MSTDTARRLVRGAIARHLEGPAFAWFVERERPKRRRGRPYGLDKAAPVAMLPGELLDRMQVQSPILVLTDRDVGRQQRRRRTAPADDYRTIQEIVDNVPPHSESGLWRFARDGRRLDVRVRRGVAEVAAFSRAG